MRWLAAIALLGLAAAASWWLNRDTGPVGGGQRGGFGGAVTVVTAPVERVVVTRDVEAIGTVVANESVQITSKVTSTIDEIRFVEGQTVAAGAILVELESNEIEANLAEAEAALVESRRQYERGQELFETRTISESQLLQLQATMQADEARLEANRARLADYVIRAPFGGRVGLRRVSLGSLVRPGDVITTLDDLQPMKLDFDVPETALAAIRDGLVVSATSAAWPTRDFRGEVASVDTRVDPVTRSVTVRSLIDNTEGLLKPGMFMTVRLQQPPRDVLMVPEEAIVPEEDRQYVFVVEEGRAARRRVEIDFREPGRVAIADGLAEGEEVITLGTIKVRDGVPVLVLDQTEDVA